MIRIDTTCEVYTKKLAGYEKEMDDICDRFEEVMAWVASSGTEGHDALLDYGHEYFGVNWDSLCKVQFSDPNITAALDLARDYEDELSDLRDEIWCSRLEGHLEEYAAARAAYGNAKRDTVA
jgi:hypothetical protein